MRRIVASILIFSFFLIASPIIYFWPQIECGDICEKNQYTENEKCTHKKPLSFIGIKIADTLNHNEGAVVGGATFLLAFITFFLVIFTRGLMIYTRKLWGATDTLVIDAKDTSKAELRAYVAIDIDSFTAIESGNDWRPQFCVENYGNTPARNVTIFRHFTEHAPTTIDEFTYGNPESRTFLLQNITIQPRQRFRCFYADSLTGISNNVLYGYIEYADVFGRKWRSRFAYHFRGSVKNVTPHENHNDEIEILSPQS